MHKSIARYSIISLQHREEGKKMHRENQNARKFDVIELAIKINPNPQTVGFSTSPVLVLGIGKKNPTKKGVKFYDIMWHLLNRNR